MKMPKQAKPVQRNVHGGAIRRNQVKASDACCGSGTCLGACVCVPIAGCKCLGKCI